ARLDALARLPPRVGLRLRAWVECAARLHRLSPPEARARGRTFDDPQRARRRLRTARRIVTLRTRMAAVAGLAVALTAIGLAIANYAVTRSTLRGQIDASLQRRAEYF